MLINSSLLASGKRHIHRDFWLVQSNLDSICPREAHGQRHRLCMSCRWSKRGIPGVFRLVPSGSWGSAEPNIFVLSLTWIWTVRTRPSPFAPQPLELIAAALVSISNPTISAAVRFRSVSPLCCSVWNLHFWLKVEWRTEPCPETKRRVRKSENWCSNVCYIIVSILISLISWSLGGHTGPNWKPIREVNWARVCLICYKYKFIKTQTRFLINNSFSLM